MDIQKEIANRLRELRKNHGTTQGIDSKVRQQTISDWESGKIPHALMKLREIAKHYGVTADYLLGLTDIAAVEAQPPQPSPQVPGVSFDAPGLPHKDHTMSENIQLRFEWQCPHCGHNNVNYASLIGSFGQMGMQVIYCCVEDGGCDELVAVLPNAQVSAKVYKLVEAQATPKV